MSKYQKSYNRVMKTAGLEKQAVKIPVIHGTHNRWDELKAGVGKAIAPNDPNPRAVYVGTDNSMTRPGIEGLARDAVDSRGGEPVVAHAKIDTSEGWIPHGLSGWARDKGIDRDHILENIELLDETGPYRVKGEERGKLWEEIQRSVGSWKNRDPNTTLEPNYYKKVE